jgi:DNA replication protein DnaC
LLVDREAADRNTKRLTTRLKFAALPQSACVKDVDLRTPRAIDRAVFARLAAGDWINRNENLLITGATGLGKSWIACALGHKACRDNRSVQYHRVPRLFEALALARGDGRYGRLLKTIGRLQLLILDDWGLSVLNPPVGATFWRSLMIAMVAPRPSLPARSPRTLARRYRRPHPRRRYPGSPRSQRSPPSTLRRKHAKTERPQSNS